MACADKLSDCPNWAEGKKDWRVEVSATLEEKDAAAAALRDFKDAFPLQQLKLDDIYNEHVRHLEALVAGGAVQHRAWYRGRLARGGWR